MMNRLIAALQTTILLAGLLVLAVPADLACCSGVAEVHGPSCCESADTDALAASCCAGELGPLALRAEAPLPPPLLVPTVKPLSAALALATNQPQLDEAIPARPPDGGLFTLHSAFLI